MTQSFMEKLKVFAAMLCIGTVIVSCGKPDFNIATAPPDVGGNKNDAKDLIDTTLKFDNSRIMQAAIWPGLVCNSEPRYPSVVLNMDLNYKTVGTNLRESVPPAPMFSTGYYAAPGELITIDVPAGIYSLSVQIGSTTEDLSNRVNPARDPIIYVKSQLSPGRNYLRNLYGGPVWINSDVPIANPVALTLGNVVKSPDFVLGETDPAQWYAAIQNSCVPQLEIRSKFVSFAVPREYCVEYPINNILNVLAEWDSIIRYDYDAWKGLSFNAADPVDQAPLLPYRVVFDIQLSNPMAYGHNGNPVMATSDLSWFGGIGSLSPITGGGNWGFFHEIGHNNQQNDYWSWSTLGETTNNLFSFKVADRMSKSGSGIWPPKHPALATQFPLALAFAASSGAKDFDGSDSRINDPFSRITPFAQLFDYIKPNMVGVNNSNKDGWALMGVLYSTARRAVRPNITDLSKHDFVYRAVCNMTHYDWLSFFNAWGITVSDVAQSDMAAQYPPITYNVWTYNPLTRTGGNTYFNPDPAYIPSKWKIISYSSQNADGSSGLAKYLIDGDATTYWHTQYSPSIVSPPHFAVIDLQKQLSISKIQIAHRPSGASTSRAIKNIFVDYSNDNVNWTYAPLPNLRSGDGRYIVTQNVQGLQQFTLTTPITARYIRVRIPLSTDMFTTDNLACLAEFEVLL